MNSKIYNALFDAYKTNHIGGFNLGQPNKTNTTQGLAKFNLSDVWKIYKKHKVFVSFHSNDIYYKEKFIELFSKKFDGFIDKSVGDGDIDNKIKTETTRTKIRDEYLNDTTVTVVLIGEKTWQRRHVDWEISSSLINGAKNKRSGLLGIILPTYIMIDSTHYNKKTIPPRLWNNIDSKYAKIINWTEDVDFIIDKIHEAFENRLTKKIDNSYPAFINCKFANEWS